MELGEYRFLIVDDYLKMTQMIRTALSRFGCRYVWSETDPSVAIERMKREGVTFLICDWSMPKKSGVDIANEMKADPVLAKIPVLMISGEAGKKEVVEALKAGVDDYLLKPFSTKDLKDKIIEVLKRRRAGKAQVSLEGGALEPVPEVLRAESSGAETPQTEAQEAAPFGGERQGLQPAQEEPPDPAELLTRSEEYVKLLKVYLKMVDRRVEILRVARLSGIATADLMPMLEDYRALGLVKLTRDEVKFLKPEEPELLKRLEERVT